MNVPLAYLAGLATIPAVLAVSGLYDCWLDSRAWNHYCSEYKRLTEEYDELSDEAKADFLAEKPDWSNHSDERGRYFSRYFQPKRTSE